jgi:hypothetical protein
LDLRLIWAYRTFGSAGGRGLGGGGLSRKTNLSGSPLPYKPLSPQ